MSGVERFAEFLKTRIGLDVGTVGPSVIERAVRLRLAAGVAGDSDGYWTLLQESPQERQALIEAVIVPETWFFRYPDSFSLLARLAQERLATLAGARPLRILSLPCATGEEPYSIVMALLDAGIPAASFGVDALDVSPKLIERAQLGYYGQNSFRGEALGFRERYFTWHEHGYRLAERIRALVHFRCGNLLDPGLLADEPPYDVVFCRNLLIYFDQATQKAVFSALARLARRDGVFFIGPAEASLFSRMGLAALGVPNSFAFRFPEPVVAVVPEAKPAAPPAEPPPARRAVHVQRDARPRKAPPQRSKPASPVEAGTSLQAIAALADQGRLAEARQSCERLLAERGPDADAFYWLGLLSDAEGKPGDARGYYRKALYLKPQHREALHHLAALLTAEGDIAGARQLRARAGRGVEGHG